MFKLQVILLIFMVFTITMGQGKTDTIECITKNGNKIILFPNNIWTYLDNKSDTSKALAISSNFKLPAKRQFKHPPFTTDISDDFYYEETYNKFRDITTQSVCIKLKEELSLCFTNLFSGNEFKISPDIMLKIVSKSEEWEYLKNSSLILLLDDERIDLGEMERDGSIGDGYVLEFLDTTIPLQTFIKLVNAKKVQGQLFTTEFELIDAQLEAIRDFGSKLTQK